MPDSPDKEKFWSIFWRYVREDISQSFEFWDQGSRMGAIVGALIASVLTALLYVGYTISVDKQAMWAIYALPGVWFFFLMVFVTPFRMWQAQRVQIAELSERLVPRIEISDPEADHEPWGQDATLKARRIWRITIRNLSSTALKNVSVEDHEFKNALGRVAPESGRLFRLSKERPGMPHGKFTSKFDLNGFDAQKNIDICAMDETKPDSPVQMIYTSPQKNLLSRGAIWPHTLIVRVTADNMAVPKDKKFRISITNDGFLKMETIE